MSERGDRIAYIDGLRGIAIGMVMVTHAWTHDPPHIWNPVWSHNKMVPGTHATLLDFLANRGYQGVSLFLVLSGFCLSYPALRRRAAGAERWFVPSQFFARRCLRILPPYFAALALAIGLMTLFHEMHLPPLPAMGTTTLSPLDLVSHLLLLHNLTGDAYSINSPFWSLGLEWQWYWLFPVVLLFAVRAPFRTALALLVLACVWQTTFMDMAIVMSWLPGRLFEFCCGILAAQGVVSGWKVRTSWLALGMVGVLGIAEAPIGTVVGDTGLYQPLYGVVFGLLVLLGHRVPRLNAALSIRPLAALGVASYGVYLVHRPVSDIVEAFAPLWLRSTVWLIPVALISGLTVGVAFHLLVERPCMRRETWLRVQPLLQHALGWTDRLYGMRAPRSSGRAPSLDDALLPATE